MKSESYLLQPVLDERPTPVRDCQTAQRIHDPPIAADVPFLSHGKVPMPSKRQGFPRGSELTVFVGMMLLSGVITFGIAQMLASRAKGPSAAHAADQKDLASTNRSTASSRPWTPADGDAHACAMHCEPGKLYASGAICPVCRMRTDPVSKLPYTVSVAAESASGESTVSGGTPVRLNWKIKDPSGLELSPKALEAVHFGPLAIAHTSLAGVLPVAVADTADIPSVVFDAAQLGPITLQPESDSDRAAATTYLLLGSAQLPVYTPPSSAPVSVDASKPNADSAAQPARPFAARFVLPAATASAATTGRLATPAKLIEDFDVVKIADRAEGRYEARIRCNGRFYHANEASLFRVNIQRRPNATDTLASAKDSLAAQPPIDLDTLSPNAPDRIELVIVSNDLRTPLGPIRIADPADPLAKEATDLGNGKPTDALFAVNFPTPGYYRMFFIVTPSLPTGGTPFTIPFTINALEAEGSAASPSESATPAEPHPDADPSHKHHHHAED